MSQSGPETATSNPPPTPWALQLLGASVWVSTSLFGGFILLFYIADLWSPQPQRWNRILPLYQPGSPGGNGAMGLHLLGGALLLLLGNVQLLSSVRERLPVLHRVCGRLYVLGALAAGIGGLGFIAARGTIGGVVMDLGFGLYGLLMLATAAMTVGNARARRFAAHRAWALRLYALAIGSWLYRMDYGFWVLLTDGWGTATGFVGPFDYFMDFAFYLPNLLVVELYLRTGSRDSDGAWTAVLLAATAFVALGTYFFARYYWLPGMALAFA